MKTKQTYGRVFAFNDIFLFMMENIKMKNMDEHGNFQNERDE